MQVKSTRGRTSHGGECVCLTGLKGLGQGGLMVWNEVITFFKHQDMTLSMFLENTWLLRQHHGSAFSVLICHDSSECQLWDPAGSFRQNQASRGEGGGGGCLPPTLALALLRETMRLLALLGIFLILHLHHLIKDVLPWQCWW